MSHLQFADDIVFTVGSLNQAHILMEELQYAIQPVGLNINLQKCKYINIIPNDVIRMD